MLYIVCYDLREPSDQPANYSELIQAIRKNFPDFAHIEESVWLVKSDLDAVAIRGQLQSYAPENARLFVGLVRAFSASNMQPDVVG